MKTNIKEENVKVIAIPTDSGVETFLSSIHHSESLSATDSVDGNLPQDTVTSIKNFQLDNFNLDNQNSDGNISFTSTIPSSSHAISTIGVVSTSDNATNSNTIRLTAKQLQELQASGGANAPQVIIVDSNERNSLLGKRPAEGTAQNPTVNKIIITKNASAGQASPVQVQTINTVKSVGAQPGANIVTHTPTTPTKTITISQKGIVSPLKGITMAQVAGTPPRLPVGKLPISPAKTPTKITMIPVPGRSPQRIAPAGLASSTVVVNSRSSQPTITMSPSKIIKQPGTVHVIQKPIQPSLSGATVMTIPRQGSSVAAAGAVRQVTLPNNVQQIHVPGNKFHYIRLANPSNSASAARAQLLPAAQSSQQPQPVKINLAAQSATQIVTSRPSGASTVQRIILPAAPNQQVTIRPAPAVSTATAPQLIRTTLPAGSSGLQQIATGGGATFLSAGASGPQGVQGFALVPASYLSQIQQQIQVKPVAVTTAAAATPVITTTTSQSSARSDYVPIASNNPAVSATIQHKSVNGSLEPSRPRKPCNCTKSQCLKLYCDCFANGEFCHNCNCNNCANNLDHEEDRSRAIKSCLERNPLAFHPKIGKGRAGEKDRRHNKGCNCKRSGCLKNYCECYEAKIMCSSSCKCVGCKNFEESPERKTLMHLADAAEVRVLQQTAAKSKLSSQISDLPSRPVTSGTGERLPFSFVTNDVVEATCACLLAQAEEAERQLMPPVVQERMVIEEFGRCLIQIIESANRTKAPDPDHEDTG